MISLGLQPNRSILAIIIIVGMSFLTACARKDGAAPITWGGSYPGPVNNVGQSPLMPALPYHTVSPGDTIYSLSRRYNVGVSEIAAVNGLKSPFTIRVGGRLILPSAGSKWRTGKTAVHIPAPRVKVVRTGVKDGQASPVKKPSLETAEAKGSLFTANIPARSGPGNEFLWPVSGQVISSYGPKQNGLHNDGINIAVSKGAPVRAAQTGIVTYAGNELKGYGNLLLIKHAGGYVTAYAHNHRLLVRRGDKVSRGDIIAEAGATGSVSTPQVHFEIRKGRSAINPTKYLSGA